MPPLLQRLSELRPPKLDYLGVSYGLTPQLFKFWKRAGYVPLYIRQTTNELTGEHTCVMIRTTTTAEGEQEVAKGWLSDFAMDFRKRFLSLLSYKFRDFSSVTALSILEGANAGEVASKRKPSKSHRPAIVRKCYMLTRASLALTASELREVFSPHDMKRLVSYSNNMLDYHVILDLLPSLAILYFTNRLPATSEIKLSGVQASILMSLGLQRKVIEDVEKELKLPVSQALALFVKVIRKLTKGLEEIAKAEVEKSLPETEEAEASTSTNGAAKKAPFQPLVQTVDEELTSEGDEVTRQLRQQQREAIDSLDLKNYEIAGNEVDDSAFEAEMERKRNAIDGAVVSIKNPNSTKRKEREEASKKGDDKSKKGGKDGFKKSKKPKH